MTQKSDDDDVFNQYVRTAPSPQNAVDAVPGWTSMFPPEAGVLAGGMPLFQDARIHWALECFGPIQDKEVLELGPLEGSHTFMLDAAGARVDAIEANKGAFLRCLITKEILGIRNARFHLGDFTGWLEKTPKAYDLVIASGVLYHMNAPLQLLELIARKTNAVYLWTHYFSDELMPVGDARRGLFAHKPEEVSFHEVEVRLHRRTYAGNHARPTFCGGMVDDHRWIERHDLLRVLEALGFDSIALEHDDPAHPNGPALSVFARRSTGVP